MIDSRVRLVSGTALVVCLSGVTGSAIAASEASAAPVVEHAATLPVASAAVPVAGYPTMSEHTYLAAIHALLAGRPHAEQPDSQYTQGGRDICAQIDAGDTWADFLADADEYDLDVGFHRAAIDLATATYCPQHAGFTH